MPLFTYKAVREDGKSVTDQAVAVDARELRQELEARGYLVLSVGRKSGFSLGSGTGNPKDFLLFNQEFSTLFKAGLPILQSLEILHKRTENPAFRAALDTIIHDIKGGTALSDAMAKHPAFFAPLYTATVRAGEKSGSLGDVLKRYIVYQKKMLAIRRKLISALAYPIFLIAILFAVLLMFFFYIIPNFTQMFDKGSKLPLLTTLLITFTDGLVHYFPFVIGALAAAGAGIYGWKRTEAGQQALDAMVLRIPLVRSLMMQYVLAQLTRTLATVLRGGIPLVQALETTAGVISNRVMSRRLNEVRERVIEGVSLANAVESTKLAADMTVRMIEVGESSGDLPQMLEDIAEFYDQEVENRLGMLTTMIEPVLMVFMGGVIAVIVVALYMPIFEMGSRIK